MKFTDAPEFDAWMTYLRWIDENWSWLCALTCAACAEREVSYEAMREGHILCLACAADFEPPYFAAKRDEENER